MRWKPRHLGIAVLALLLAGAGAAAFSLFRSPPSTETKLAGIRQVPTALGCVALTFDDGPDPAQTPLLLSVLADSHVTATFFVLGDRVQHSPELTAAIAQAGHEIGNHSWSHAHFPMLSPDQIRAEIESTDQAVAAATGATPSVIRFPYGETSDAILQLVHRPVMLWDVDPFDWASSSFEGVARTVVPRVNSGSIVVLHDSFPTTVEAVPAIIDGLTERGY